MAEQDWPNLVGRFMLAFGEIEHVCTISIEIISQDGIGDIASTLPIEKRIDILKAILSKREDGESAELLSELGGVKTYIKRRNLIAHNGLSFFVKQNGKRIEFHYHIQSKRDKKFTLNYEQMEALTIETEQLKHRFNAAALDLWILLNPEERNPED
jgi:hypothetical protein